MPSFVSVIPILNGPCSPILVSHAHIQIAPIVNA
jgi:hypothetical protein